MVTDGSSEYRTQAADTTRAAEEQQFAIGRAMTPAEKFTASLELQQLAAVLADAGIRLRHPNASPREVFLRRIARTLGRDTVRKLYGFDCGEDC
jgi:hypothetical protein